MKSLPKSESKSFLALNAGVYGLAQPKGTDVTIRPEELPAKSVAKQRVRKSPEERLNKLERRWMAELKQRGYEDIKIQAIKLQLGFDCLYVPDFFVPRNTHREASKTGVVSAPTFFETKGHKWAKNMVKLRVAARVHNWAKFILVEWKDGQWLETPINP